MIGQIIELATSAIPANCLPCDGDEYLLADYPDLALVINPAFVTDTTHFRTPDRTSRIGLMGPVVGVQGGENTHTLTVTEMPAHNHDQIDHTHTTTIPFGEGVAFTPGELPVVIAQAAAPTGLSQSLMLNSGGGSSHNNIQAYEGTTFALVVR